MGVIFELAALRFHRKSWFLWLQNKEIRLFRESLKEKWSYTIKLDFILAYKTDSARYWCAFLIVFCFFFSLFYLGRVYVNTVLFSPLEIDKHTYIFGSKSMQGDPISLCHVYREVLFFFFQFSFSIFLFNFRSLMEKRAKGNEKSASCHLKITGT